MLLITMLGGGKSLINSKVCLDYNNEKPEKVSYLSFSGFFNSSWLKTFFIKIFNSNLAIPNRDYINAKILFI